MSNREYSFVSRWRVPGNAGDVAEIMSDPLRMPSWWPSVVLSAVEADDEGGVAYRLESKGWMPYVVRWRLRILPRERPLLIEFRADSDLEGHGECAIEQAGADVLLAFDWRVAARRPSLRLTAKLFQPLFVANHRWVMAMGEQSLRLEMQRRAAVSDAERAAIPPPPNPVGSRASWSMLFAVALSLIVPGSILLRCLAKRGERVEPGDAP